MAKDDEKNRELEEKKLKEWLLFKEGALDFLNLYAKKVNAAKKNIDEEIEDKDVVTLREQLTRTFALVGDISFLLAKSERQYREMQKEASLRFPDHLRSDARKMWLDGECANFRYQRDIFDHLLQGLNNKASAQKCMLNSLTQEMRDMKLHNGEL